MFYSEAGKLVIAPEDQCMRCEHAKKGVSCPLLEALGVGLAVLTEEEVSVDHCGLYKQATRHLKVVDRK